MAEYRTTLLQHKETDAKVRSRERQVSLAPSTSLRGERSRRDATHTHEPRCPRARAAKQAPLPAKGAGTNRERPVRVQGSRRCVPCCRGVPVREDIKTLKKQYDKTEDDLKALQSVGQIIGEVLKQLDEERCEPRRHAGDGPLAVPCPTVYTPT